METQNLGADFRSVKPESTNVPSVFGIRVSVLTSFMLLTSLLPSSAATKLSSSEMEYFESKVRPILAANCYRCHSTEEGKIKGGLELDWKGGWQQGGDSGVVIVPGNPDESPLIAAIRYTDPDLQMPPKGEKLSDVQIAVLEQWVKMGAPDPRDKKSDGAIQVDETDKNHWAFQPVRNPVPPNVKDADWPKNEIDNFILAKLEITGLTPSEQADRRTLIRRAYFDLIGLPPTVEEVHLFIRDESPNAWEKVVDKLLASPRYGERWGRHWLDVARYSDTKGQFNRNRDTSSYPYAWTYRDYVINSFNDDKPYDQFVMEQIAADKLPAAKRDKDTLAALGFLTVGDRFNGMAHDIINDRIDVTTKAFLGMTVSCSRCHDHMFDPIPTEDYYALHGVFNSSFEPDELPVIAKMGTADEQNDYQVQLLGLEVRRAELVKEIVAESFGDYKKHSAVYLYALMLPQKDRNAYLEKNGANPKLLNNWQRLVGFGARSEFKVFTSFNYLSRLPDKKYAQAAPRFFKNLPKSRQAKNFHPSVMKMLTTVQPKTKGELAAAYGNLIGGRDRAFNKSMDALLEDGGTRVVRGRKRNQYRAFNEQMAALELAHPGAPGRAMVIYDAVNPKDSPVFIRGEANNKGEIVPRRSLEVLSGSEQTRFTNGSGRLDLARSIANESNPLTARVMVNRVWQHHFGVGFVDTPDDIGNQSEDPSHPELIDYLATQFMQNGWAVKSLHKAILMSATWQQSSKTNPQHAGIDPFNRMLWRANVRRLEFEPLRDSILYMGGQLDLTMGGKPVDLSEGTHVSQSRNASMLTRRGNVKLSQDYRRSVYGFVDRADVMEMMNIFDFASPDMPTGRRYETTVPQQALFLMNSPLVIEQAKNMVHRLEFVEIESDEERIFFLYELLFQRVPSVVETKLGQEFIAGFADDQLQLENLGNVDPKRNVAGQTTKKKGGKKGKTAVKPAKKMSGWAEYAHALLLTDEACFVN